MFHEVIQKIKVACLMDHGAYIHRVSKKKQATLFFS